jgi:hypothetical protein
MSNKPFTVGAILNSVSHTKDGGVRVGFVTQELSPDEQYYIVSQMQKYGYLLFSPNEISEKDIPTEQAEDKNKTPSKRLRSALFVLYKQTGTKQDFDLWYRDKMEKIINNVKSKLD